MYSVHVRRRGRGLGRLGSGVAEIEVRGRNVDWKNVSVYAPASVSDDDLARYAVATWPATVQWVERLLYDGSGAMADLTQGRGGMFQGTRVIMLEPYRAAPVAPSADLSLSRDASTRMLTELEKPSGVYAVSSSGELVTGEEYNAAAKAEYIEQQRAALAADSGVRVAGFGKFGLLVAAGLAFAFLRKRR